MARRKLSIEDIEDKVAKLQTKKRFYKHAIEKLQTQITNFENKVLKMRLDRIENKVEVEEV